MPIQHNKNAEYYVQTLTNLTFWPTYMETPRHWLSSILLSVFKQNSTVQQDLLIKEIETISLSSIPNCEALAFHDVRKDDDQRIECTVLVKTKNGDDVAIEWRDLEYKINPKTDDDSISIDWPSIKYTINPKTDEDHHNNQIFIDELNRYLNHVEMLNKKNPLTFDNLSKYMPTIDQAIRTTTDYERTKKPLRLTFEFAKAIINKLFTDRCITTLDQARQVLKAFDEIIPQKIESSENSKRLIEQSDPLVDPSLLLDRDTVFYTKIDSLFMTDRPIIVKTSGPAVWFTKNRIELNFYYCSSILIDMLRKSDRLKPTMTKSSRVIDRFNIPIEFVLNNNAQKIVEVPEKMVNDVLIKLNSPGYKSINKTTGIGNYLDKHGTPNSIGFLDVLDADDIVIVN